MEHLLYLNIAFNKTDRDIDMNLGDSDKISIVYYPSESIEEISTSLITFKELFNLIQNNTRTESLQTMLNYEREKTKTLTIENKTLKNEVDILKSAFNMIKEK